MLRPFARPSAAFFVLLGFAASGLRVMAQTDGSAKWAFTALSTSTAGAILSSPSVAPDGAIYFGLEIGASSSATPGGQVFALNPNGTQKWVFSGATDWIDSAPAIARDGTVYVGSWDGNLYALRPENGTVKWTFRASSYISSSPALGADGTIYFGCGNGNFFAVNPDGTQKWLFPALYWIDAPPAVAPDGTIYFGSLDNNFYALNPDGTEKWHFGAGNDITTAPAIAADGTVYFGSRDTSLYALTPGGALKWSFATPDTIEASPVLGDDGTIYCATTGGRMYSLRPDGTEKWRYPAAGQSPLNALYSTPAVRADGSIIFGSSNNALYALRPDGTLLWRATVGDWSDSSALVTTDGSIYIGSYDKKLYAFNGTVPASMTDWPQLNRDPQRTAQQPIGAVTGTTGRLINLSVRTFAGNGADRLAAGFVTRGAGARTLLVRGVGPALQGFGVPGFMPDPKLTLFSGGAALVSNDNWQQQTDPSSVANTATAVGAFSLPSGNLDAALLRDLSAGSYTAEISAASGGTGIALVEVYDAGGAATSRLINVSARSLVQSGVGVLVAGFVVREQTRALLVRGVGPGLTQFGVPGVLANPQLSVHRDGVLVAQNDDWSRASNAAALAQRAAGVGAFTLPDNSADAVLLLTLPPGTYTAQVSGAANGSGIGLVELYEVP